MASTSADKQRLEEELDLKTFEEFKHAIYERSTQVAADNKFSRYINQARLQPQKPYKRDEERNVQEQESLARELGQIKKNEIKEIMLRQALRQSSPELRELEAKLKNAYISKALYSQIKENEALRLNEKLEEKRQRAELEKAYRTAEEQRQIQKQEEMIKKAEYRRDLQDQMIYAEKQRRFQYEQFLLEKKRIDAIVQRIHDEDEREIHEKMVKMKKTKEEMVEFAEARKIWREKELQEMLEENKKLEEYILQKTINDLERQREKNAIDVQRDKIREKVSRDMAEQLAKKEELQNLFEELEEIRAREKEDTNIQAKFEERLKRRMEMNQTLAWQIKEKEKQAQEEIEENRKYKEYWIAKQAEAERLEQLSEQNRRRKMLLIRRDIEKMMEEKRLQRAEELHIMQKLLEEEKAELDTRNRLIEQERKKMLEEHARNLMGFMPKGVLRKDEVEKYSLKRDINKRNRES